MKRKLLTSIGVAALTALALCACSNTGSSTKASGAAANESSQESNTQAEGSADSITVMIPEWAVPSDALLKEFTDQSGISVNISQVD